MSDAEVCFLSAGEMARMIRERKLSARDVVEAHLRQIERVNPAVNAMVTVAPEMALAAAVRSDELLAAGGPVGRLHGVPVAVKDLRETAGIRTTFGSWLYADHVPDRDDLVVERWRRAGAIAIGKTNTPEFGAGSQTFNEVFGVTRNPWDLGKTCGGSTGGGAVALACGMAAMADGTDMGGSLRNPAAFCNVTGFRPSVGRVPNPGAAFAWSTLSTAGCLGRSAKDVALGLSALAGPDARDPLSIQEPGEVFAGALERDFRGVRVAWFQGLGGIPFERQVRGLVDGHRATFEALGCVVEEAEPDFGLAEVSFRTLRAWESANAHGARVGSVKEVLRREVEEGLRLSSMDLARAETARGELWRGFQAFMEKYEYFVLPTTQVAAFDVEWEWPQEVAGVRMESYIDWMKSCWYVSATGNPAASVPCGFTPEGLPVGLQIVGRHRADFGVLQMAHAFEEATGFGRKRCRLA